MLPLAELQGLSIEFDESEDLPPSDAGDEPGEPADDPAEVDSQPKAEPETTR